MDTLVVNFFGGAGSGKSTTAAGVFHELKKRGLASELANEFAKDLVYDERYMAFQDQFYIFGNQHYRLFR